MGRGRESRVGRTIMAGVGGLMSLWLFGCEDGPRPAPFPERSAPPPEEPLPRPARRYILENSGDRCAVRWEEAGQKSMLHGVCCARQVFDGESVRLTWRQCLRKSADETRRAPTRCPKELLYLEGADQTGGKRYPDYLLPPAK